MEATLSPIEFKATLNLPFLLDKDESHSRPRSRRRGALQTSSYQLLKSQKSPRSKTLRLSLSTLIHLLLENSSETNPQRENPKFPETVPPQSDFSWWRRLKPASTAAIGKNCQIVSQADTCLNMESGQKAEKSATDKLNCFLLFSSFRPSS